MHYFLKIVLFVAAVLLSFAYIGYSIPSRPSLPPEEEKFDLALIKTKNDLVQIGQKIFFGKGQCALCHSIGPSETARCPILEGVGAKLTREFIYESLTKPQAYIYMQYEFSPAKLFAAKMPAINKPPIGLNENELLAVIAFLQSLGGPEDVTVDPSELVQPAHGLLAVTGNVEAGRTVFKQAGCVKCHGIGGEKGGAQGPDLLPIVNRQDELYLRGVLQGTNASRAHQGFDQRLTVREFNDLMAYLVHFKAMSRSL
ncbi:MAG: c-type cytochrome [Nitrospiria bacterium]